LAIVNKNESNVYISQIDLAPEKQADSHLLNFVFELKVAYLSYNVQLACVLLRA